MKIETIIAEELVHQNKIMNRVKSYKQSINEKENISSLEHVTFLRGFVMWEEKKSITEHKNIPSLCGSVWVLHSVI